MVKKYRKWSFWKLTNCFWRCNIVLSRHPRCTCTKPNTVPRTFSIVITAECRMKNLNLWSSETACHVHSSYDWLYKPLSLAILQRFLKYCWLTKFPLLLLYPKLSSLRNECSINLNLSDHVHFLRKNMTIAVYRIKKESMFYLW